MPAQGINDLEPVRHVLPNGLRAVVLHMPHTRRAVVHTQLNVGSRYETPALNGISHFLEHMIYRGTRTYPSAHEQALAFESLGGTLSAATATDMGSMAITVPPQNVDRVLPILAEIFLAPRFDGIGIERGIVTEEILEGLDDDGNSIDADNLIRAQTFADHPLGMPITGTLKHLRRFNRETLRTHHQQHYTANNTVIGIAGPMDPDGVLQQLEAQFSGLQPGTMPECSPPPEQAAARFHYVRHSSSQTELRVGFRAPGAFDPDEPAMELLMRLLDDGLATRLYHRICDQRGLCYDVAAHYETYADSGLVEFEAESGHARVAAVLKELFALLTELREQGPSDQELARAKQRHGWQFDFMRDSAEEAIEFVTVEEQSGQRRSASARHAQVAAVTAQQVVEVSRRWLSPSQLSVVAVGMLNKTQRAELERLTRAFG